jgi:hypothetical protein
MRPTFRNLRLPLTLTLVSVLGAAPAMANDAPAITFVSGTGIETADVAYDAPAPLPFADVDAPQSDVRDARDAEADMIAMGDKMSDPDMQDGVANMVEKMGDAMMRMPIGKFASAIEKARPGTVSRRIRDRDTIADIAGDDARDMPEMLGKQSRVAMNMMGGFAKAFASMMPEFEKMGREMEASIADFKPKRR